MLHLWGLNGSESDSWRNQERFIFTGSDDFKVGDFLRLIRHNPLPGQPFLTYCPWLAHFLLSHASAKIRNKHFLLSGIYPLSPFMFPAVNLVLYLPPHPPAPCNTPRY